MSIINRFTYSACTTNVRSFSSLWMRVARVVVVGVGDGAAGILFRCSMVQRNISTDGCADEWACERKETTSAKIPRNILHKLSNLISSVCARVRVCAWVWIHFTVRFVGEFHSFATSVVRTLSFERFFFLHFFWLICEQRRVPMFRWCAHRIIKN